MCSAIALLLPSPLSAEAVREIALPTLLILPLATATLGVLLNDLLERDRIEQALRFSEARLRAITQAIPDLLLVLDEDGRYLEILCAERSLHTTGRPSCSAAACMTSCPRPRAAISRFHPADPQQRLTAADRI